MSKSRLMTVRVDESLLGLIKATAIILDRKESETIRILITRACKYWIARGQVNNNQEKAIITIKEQSTVDNPPVDDKELQELQAMMKLLK